MFTHMWPIDQSIHLVSSAYLLFWGFLYKVIMIDLSEYGINQSEHSTEWKVFAVNKIIISYYPFLRHSYRNGTNSSSLVGNHNQCYTHFTGLSQSALRVFEGVYWVKLNCPELSERQDDHPDVCSLCPTISCLLTTSHRLNFGLGYLIFFYHIIMLSFLSATPVCIPEDALCILHSVFRIHNPGCVYCCCMTAEEVWSMDNIIYC